MLTGKQKQYLKALASHLPATVQIGKEGLTFSVIGSAEKNITANELIKVKINQNSVEDIRHVAELLADNLGCELVQVIGRNCVLFRQKDDKSHYELPR